MYQHLLSLLSLLLLPVLALGAPTATFHTRNTVTASVASLSSRAVLSAALPAAPNQAQVLNSCDYPVYLQSVSFAGEDQILIPPHKAYIAPLVLSCPTCGGVSLKVSRQPNAPTVLQFEYTAKDGLIWYNLSMIDCLKAGRDSADGSSCPGWEGGLQGGGGGTCKKFTCGPGQKCDGEVYWIEEFGGKDGAPVSSCAIENGVTFELCAANRK